MTLKKEKRPNCKICGKPAEAKGAKSALGFKKYKNTCATCHGQRNRSGNYYAAHKGDQCELCGFLPINKCQLDIDHKDGNRMNNDIKNLQTLCANCHRLKTYLNRKGL